MNRERLLARMRWVMIVGTLVTALCSCLPGCATTPVKHVSDDPIGVIVVSVDNEPELLSFITADGRVAEWGYGDCGQSAACDAALTRLVRDHKADFIDIRVMTPRKDM